MSPEKNPGFNGKTRGYDRSLSQPEYWIENNDTLLPLPPPPPHCRPYDRSISQQEHTYSRENL